jgi:hypothetical protein
MRSCDTPNDARLRYAERCTVAICRTSRRWSASTIAYPDVAKVRTFLPQGRSVPKVRPKGQVETSLMHGVTTVARPGDVERMRMPRHWSGKARLMLPPWHRPGEVQLMLPPWHGPGEVELLLPPWHGPGKVEQVLPAWYRSGAAEML